MNVSGPLSVAPAVSAPARDGRAASEGASLFGAVLALADSGSDGAGALGTTSGETEPSCAIPEDPSAGIDGADAVPSPLALLIARTTDASISVDPDAPGSGTPTDDAPTEHATASPLVADAAAVQAATVSLSGVAAVRSDQETAVASSASVTPAAQAAPAAEAAQAAQASTSAPSARTAADTSGENGGNPSMRAATSPSAPFLPASALASSPATPAPSDGVRAHADGRSAAIDPARDAATGEAPDRLATGASPADRAPNGPASAPASVPLVAPGPAPVGATPTTTDTPPAAVLARSVAAQLAPEVMSIAQRPTGSHQLTMTISPDSVGPVTLRAHIGKDGDVQIELRGATDAGRDALRVIVADLRRDLASVMPHATLSLVNGSAADASADRGAAFGSDPGAQAQGSRDSARGTAETPSDARRAPATTPTPTTLLADHGDGLDIFA